MASKRGIVAGQRIGAVKVERSRELRREMTPAERLLWEGLRGSRLGGLKFRRQQIIDGFIVDFYCDSAGLVVEVDGAVHHERVEDDAERDQALIRRGLRVLRLSNDQVEHDLDGALARVAECCE